MKRRTRDELIAYLAERFAAGAVEQIYDWTPLSEAEMAKMQDDLEFEFEHALGLFVPEVAPSRPVSGGREQ